MANDIERWQRRLKLVNEERNERIREAQQTVPESTPTKPKYSTDNLSMLDLSGGAVAGVMDMTDNLVNPIVEGVQGIADYVKSSNAYKKYMYTDEEKKLEAKNISIETGIPVNALLMSDENMAMGRSVQEYRRKNMAFALDGDTFDMSGVYEKFPGLQAVVENPNMSDNDLAIAMHNIEDLTKAKTVAEAFSLGLEADKANYRIGEIGMLGFAGGEITPEALSEIEQLKKSLRNQKAIPSFGDNPLMAIAGGTGANLYHMERGIRRGSQFAATALAAGVGVSVASGGTAAGVAMPAAITAAGVGVRAGMAYDMFMNSAGRQYAEYSEMKSKSGEPLLTKGEARAFAAVAAGIETGVEFWNYNQVMNLLGANYKREIKEIVAKADGDQNLLKAGLVKFLQERGAMTARAMMTEAAEEAVQDIGDKAVHNAIVSYAPQSAERKYTGAEFVRGALEASAEAMPGIVGLTVLGSGASHIKSVRDFARLQKMQSDILIGEIKTANGIAMIKALQENMAGSKLFKKSPEIYQATVKGAVENTEFKEVHVDTELALQDEEGQAVFNQLVEKMGLEDEEVNAIIENKADLVVPTEIYAQTVLGNDKFDQYISFDEKGHSIARKKYYMAVAEDMAKSINLEQEEKQAELIDAIIRERFPEEGVEQDMGAACILMNPANPKEAWKQMMRDVTDSINARLGGIVKNLEEGMSRGVHYYYSEESGYSVKRMSDNDAWYGDFYKQHKRKPNKAELLEMAREVYKGNGDKYGMPEYTFEATEEMQEDFDSLDNTFKEMYALEDIKGKIGDLTASEMTVVRSLTPSGYKVYQQARKQFESGNTDLQKAGRMNAILLARYADRMADNLSKITGKPYTAEDYMHERLHIVADAQNTDAQGYGQPITNLDLDLDREVDVLDLDTMSNALKGKSPKEVLAYIKEISDGVQVPTADFKAMVGLPKNIDAYGQKHIIFSKSNQQRKNIVARNKVLTNFFKVIFATRVVEISPNKKIKEENLTKTQKRKNEVSRFYRLFVPVKMNGQLYTLLLTAEDFNKNVEIDAQEVGLYEISAKKIEDNRPSATLNVQGTLPSKISIREVLQGVKDVDGNPYINSDGSGNFAVYNQTAYHGSPHTFDKFDLGAIGSGEGAQAHGWGLYFAQDRKVSERYQEKLARKNRNKGVILYDGKEDAEVSNAMRYYGSAGLYSALSKESRDEVKAQKEISNTLVGMQNDIERWDKQVKFYQKHIDRIKENPKLSITAFLKEAPKEDVGKLKDIVDEAKSFARMSGKRTNIKGVLDRLQTKQEMPLNEKDFLTRYANILENLDVDKLVVDIPTGSLLEVDIPENDVLLDEDKPLSEQPEKVRQAIVEYYRQRPEDYNVPKSENDLGAETGKQFYKDVVFQMRREGHEESPERAASELLNELGIKGITYDGLRDGRCYVVFDDKAISIIERYNQSAAMRREYFPSMEAFIEYLESNPDRYPKIGNWVRTSKGGEFIISGSAYKHVQKDKHPLTLEQWQALVDNIENVEYACVDHAKGINNGIPVQIKINTPLGKAGVSMEFLQNGKVLLSTAVFNNDAALDNWIKNKKSSQTLELENKDNQERILGNSSFIDIIQSELGIVNKVHLQSAAMRKQSFATMKDFADAIEKDRGVVTKLGNWIQTNGGSEFVIAGSSYLHIQNGAHPLTTEQWQALVDNIDNRENAESITFFDNQKGSFGGVPVGVKIKTPLGKAGAILEFLPSGKVFLVTAVFNNDKALDNWIKNKKNSHTLEIGDMMSQNRIMGSSFIDIIQSELGIVNKVHLQSATMRKENKSYVTNSQGSVDWGYVNEAVADDGTQIKKAPIRMQIGYQVGKDKAGNGYTHIRNRHWDFIQAKGYKSIEDAVYDVLDSHDFIVQEENATGTRLKLIKDLSPKTSIMLTLDLVTDENTGEVFYAPNSLLPRSNKQVANEKRKALVFLGERSPQDQSPATGAFRASSGKKAGSVEGSFARKNTSAFDTISISEVEKYVKKFTYSDGVEQRSVASMVRGQTRISGMSRVVSLFESADKSTFVHELGHVALADLKMLAEMDHAPQQLVRDWQTVKEWLGYKDSQGFTREQHERFARGFEAYLRTGEAPVRGLKAVFRTFKKWLCDIYADFIQLGGKPSPKVQAVMARMLASEEEIEAEARLQGIESITRKRGMRILDDTTQAMYERWVHEAKEEAKERVLRVAMQDIGDDYARQREAVISDMRKGIEDSLREKDVFRAEECVRLSGGTDILPTLGYTEEQYRAELAVYGGSFAAAVERELADAVADLDSQKVSEERIKEEAQRAVSSSRYKSMLLTLEYEALSRKEAAESRLDKSVDKALDAMERELRGEENVQDKESKEVKSLKQRIADLKYTYRWREAEMKLINQLQAQAAKAEAKRAKEEAVEKAVGKVKAKAEQDKELMLLTVKRLKEAVASSKDGIRLVRDAIEGQTALYKRAAAMQMMYMPIRQGTAVASWRQKERMKGAEVTRLMAKGKWAEAKQAKLEQVMFSYFVDESLRLKADVEKKVNRLKKRSKSIAKGNVKLAVDERYFYNHLLYVFGINRRDAPVPQEWDGTKSIEDMFERYKDGCEAFFTNEDGNVEIPSFIKVAAGGNDVYRVPVDMGKKKPVAALGYGALTKSEWDGLYEILTRVYTVGRNANRLYTVVDEKGQAVSFEDAVERIVEGVKRNVRVKADKDSTGATREGWFASKLRVVGNLVGDLIKPETIFLRNDGGEDGVSMRSLYDPLKRASDKKMRMQAESTRAVRDMFAVHGMKDWHKQKYRFGTSVLDKEQLIVLALNWGTEINRKRVVDGYHVTEQEVMEALSNLDAKDWQLVMSLWAHIGSFWEETVAVEERMTGVGIVKQEALPFVVVDKEGNVHHIAGGYYPILYDPKRSIGAADQEENDFAKQQMNSNMVLGTNRSHTKARSKGSVERQVYTTFEPLPRALDNVIHNICYREAVRDVNKLLNNKEVVAALQEAYGIEMVRGLQKWVRDNWAMDDRKDMFSKVASYLRRNMTMAVMGYRVSTAFINATNIFPMMDYLGAVGTYKAMRDFMRNPIKNWEDCKSRSVFLAERAQTMDRDVREKLSESRHSRRGKIVGWYSDNAFSLMAFTDLICAAPLWRSAYNRVWQEKWAEGLEPDVIEQQAVAAGDAAVRRVFGSGDVKDLAPVQRGNEVAKGLTMYYSYMNTVFNALVLKGAIANDRRGQKAWASMAQSVLYWCILTRVAEEALRASWGDDDDDYLDRLKNTFNTEKMVQSLGEQVTGMVPIVRDIFKAVMEVIVDGRTFDPNYTSAYDGISRAVKTAQVFRSKKKDWIDVGREATKTVNAFTGWKDTMTDGAWTLLRYGEGGFDEDVGDVLKAIIFDKKLK